MQLTVESVQPAKTGKSLRVKANGEWYGAKKDSGITAGLVIDAEVEEGEYGKWINKWKGMSNAPAPQAKPANGGASTVGAPWLPFASNTVAHAITAGLITDAGQVSAWAKAAKEAYEALA